MKHLKNIPHMPTSVPGEFSFGQIGNILAIYNHLTRIKIIQPSHNIHNRSFACAAGTIDRHEFSRFHLQINPF